MYCPKCAVPVSDDQKFCRSCGFDLQILSQILTEESSDWAHFNLPALLFQILTGKSSTDEPEESLSKTAKAVQRRKSRLQHGGVITLMFGLLVGCLIPITAGLVVYYPDIAPIIPILAGMAGFLLFAGIILMLFANNLRRAFYDRESSERLSLPRAEKTNKLPPENHPEFASSVTEHTTDLLQTAEVERKRV